MQGGLTSMFTMRIGGVLFSISAPLPISTSSTLPWYREFAAIPEPEVPDRDTVRIDLVPDLPPLPEGLRLLTHAGPWSMFAGGSSRYMVWHRGQSGQPSWYARFQVPRTECVTVFCGPQEIRTEGGKQTIRNRFVYPLDQVLSMYVLAESGGLIIHAAGLVEAGSGLVCGGRSGAGKSTLSRVWRGQGGECLSDDRIILRSEAQEGGGRKWKAYGTPWPGELGIARNTDVLAHAIVLLRNAGENQAVRLSQRDAFERLLPVTSLLWFDPDMLPRCLSACEAMAADLPVYEFSFTRDERASEALKALIVKPSPCVPCGD